MASPPGLPRERGVQEAHCCTQAANFRRFSDQEQTDAHYARRFRTTLDSGQQGGVAIVHILIEGKRPCTGHITGNPRNRRMPIHFMQFDT